MADGLVKWVGQGVETVVWRAPARRRLCGSLARPAADLATRLSGPVISYDRFSHSDSLGLGSDRCIALSRWWIGDIGRGHVPRHGLQQHERYAAAA
jgi:hypothetical protein